MATLSKAFDISKFCKSATKSIANISTGFNDPTDWVSTGSYLLNKLISNDFNKGIPLGKIVMFAGESGSGKSYICSANIVRNAQAQGIFTVLIDSENALDETWLKNAGVDTSPDKLMRVSLSMLDDLAKFTSEFTKDYKNEYVDLPREEQPKVLFVVDSLGMLMTPVDLAQYAAGEMKGDLGRGAKQRKAYIVNCVNTFGNLNIGMILTNHTYASMDMFSPDPSISGGSGPIFASSIVVGMKKGKLKKDKEGKKTTEVTGIRAMVHVVKSRYSKPFERAELDIPYSSGIDPYTGLIEFFERRGAFTKEGNSFVYIDNSGNIHKNMSKNITHELLDQIMEEWDESKYGFKSNGDLVDDETKKVEKV